jgi:hypothetical protein
MSDTETAITGGCLCGAVRFRSTAAPLAARCCWCRLCQHIGAGGPTVNAVFPSAAVTIEGQTQAYDCIADSGTPMRRRFCPTCGCHLFSNAQTRPHLIVIRVGALDDPDLAAPGSTIWTDGAPRWACIDPDLPQFPAMPPP